MPDRESGPKIGFEWELSIFRGARSLFRKIFVKKLEPARPGAVELTVVERRLGVVAQVIAGWPIRLQPSARGTGICGGVFGGTIYLPNSTGVYEAETDNQEFLLLRTIVSAAMLRVGPRRTKRTDKLLEIELDTVRRAIDLLSAEHPQFLARWSRLCSDELVRLDGFGGEAHQKRCDLLSLYAPETGRSATKTQETKSFRDFLLWGPVLCEDALPEPIEAADPDGAERLVTTEKHARQITAQDLEIVHLDKKELEDAVMQHTFEKIETADEYQGGARDLDGSDELQDHEEALSEVPLGKMIRTQERAGANILADVTGLSEIPDVEEIGASESGISYDEWSHQKRAYLREHCTVYPTVFRTTDERWANETLIRHRKVLTELLAKVEHERARLLPVRRRRDGQDIDLDALVEHFAAQHAGEVHNDRLYRSRRRALRDVATTLLLDISLSSDGYVDDRRILDVGREAALLLGELAHRLGEPFVIQAFASATRHKCRVYSIYEEGEPWKLGKARLGAIRPQGYTRIGAALRHAVTGLQRRGAQRKILLVLTDGKPSDYDRYEGEHGTQDVRRAVIEASGKGVWVHALGLDPRSRDVFPSMWGQGHWTVLRSVTELPDVLTTIQELSRR